MSIWRRPGPGGCLVMSSPNVPLAGPKVRARHLGALLACGAFVAVLYFLSQYNYLLFHSLIEMASVIVGVLLFTVAARMHVRAGTTLMMLLGIGFFWAGAVDMVHMLAYKGRGYSPKAVPTFPRNCGSWPGSSRPRWSCSPLSPWAAGRVDGGQRSLWSALSPVLAWRRCSADCSRRHTWMGAV